MKLYSFNGKLIDICIFASFAMLTVLVLRGLITVDFVAWDESVPYYDANQYVKWTYGPSDPVTAGGEWIFATYPTFTEALLTSLTNHLLAAKIFTIIPFPLSFVFFYYSAKKLSLGRIPSIAGAFFYAINPVSFALLFSPGQHWFYSLLPIVVITTLLYLRTMSSDKFRVYPIIILSSLYAISLAFMPQGVLLLIPVILITIFYTLVRYPQNLKKKIIKLLCNGVSVCGLTFVLLLPFSISFILPHFGFFGAGKFVNDPFQPVRNVLYENTKIYNLVRLAGIGDYHIGELGYNELSSPINLVGFILCVSVIVVLLSIFYNDRYRRKLKEITSKTPAKFDSLIVLMSILTVAVIIVELGRNGLLWQFPLASLIRNPIKPLMLIAVSMGFFMSYALFLIPFFVKHKAIFLLIFVGILSASTIYSSKFMDGTGWIGPLNKYYQSLGYKVETKDSIVTGTMKELAQFAARIYNTELEPYRFFIFPLMPSQLQFFRYNLPLISADAPGAFDAEKAYVEYIDKVNTLMLSGDNRTAISLSPLRGKYVAILNDTKSAGYEGLPRKWGGSPGALTGDPEIFAQIVSKIRGITKVPGMENILVNNYSVLPLVSYVDKAILVQGNYSELFNLYQYVTPTGNNTVVPIFADQLTQKDISPLLSSGLIKAVLHNNTDSESPSGTDLYPLDLKKLEHSYYLNLDGFPKSVLADAHKNISLNVTNSTTHMISKFPTGGDNYAYISYIPTNGLNLSKFDTLLFTLDSNIKNLQYRVSMFDDVGRQLLLAFNGSQTGAKAEYQLKVANGIIFDKDGVSILPHMNFDKIRLLTIGFFADNEFWRDHPEHKVEINVGGPYLASQKDKVTDVIIPNLPTTKKYNGIWIKQVGLNDSYISMNSGNYKRPDIHEQDTNLIFFELPSQAPNQTLRIRTQGDGPTAAMFVASDHSVEDLSKEVLSVLKSPVVLKEDSSVYRARFSGPETKLLILSYIYDKYWQSDSGMSVPVYGFLNGYLLDQGQQSLYLENYIFNEVISKLFAIFLIAWAFIFGYLVFNLRKRFKQTFLGILSKTSVRYRSD